MQCSHPCPSPAVRPCVDVICTHDQSPHNLSFENAGNWPAPSFDQAQYQQCPNNEQTHSNNRTIARSHHSDVHTKPAPWLVGSSFFIFVAGKQPQELEGGCLRLRGGAGVQACTAVWAEHHRQRRRLGRGESICGGGLGESLAWCTDTGGREAQGDCSS